MYVNISEVFVTRVIVYVCTSILFDSSFGIDLSNEKPVV